MNNILAYLEKNRRTYLFTLVIVSLLGFGRYLTFTFWKDDWFFLWTAINQLRSIPDWLHPGTALEFIIFSKLFGTSTYLWQSLGIALHIGVAVALAAFAATLTRSKNVGILAGLAYAGSYTGMDAVGWISAHVVLWSAVFLLISLTNWMKYLSERKTEYLAVTLLYFSLAIVADPFRNVVALPFYLLLAKYYVPDSPWMKRLMRRMMYVFAAGIGGFVLVMLTGYGYHVYGSQLVTHLASYAGHPAKFLGKAYVLGNYFNSVTNIMFGWFVRLQEDGSTGIYNRLASRLGFILVAMASGIAFSFRNKKSTSAGIILFSILWIYLMYVPNWFFEPRLTMGGTHRYMLLSGLGLVLLVAYLISLVKDTAVQLLLVAAFVLINMGTAKYYLSIASTYRSRSTFDTLWQTILRDAPAGDHLIFIFGGQDPVKTYSLALTGSTPYAFARHIRDPYDFPIVTGDTALIQKLICSENVPRVKSGGMTVQKEIIPLNHVFAWNVTSEGRLTDVSLPTRKSLLISALDAGCVPMVDQALIAGSK